MSVKNMEKINKYKSNNFIKILIGCAVSIIISSLSFLVLAIILVNTNVSEEIIPASVIIISIISLLIGSIISSRKINKKGIINGGAVAVIYIGIIYILSSVTLIGFELNTISILIIISLIISGMIGGIIGVNLDKI